MAADTVYISAGLPVAKNSGQSPGAGVDTAFLSAGLPPVVLAAPVGGTTNPLSLGAVNLLQGKL